MRGKRLLALLVLGLVVLSLGCIGGGGGGATTSSPSAHSTTQTTASSTAPTTSTTSSVTSTHSTTTSGRTTTTSSSTTPGITTTTTTTPVPTTTTATHPATTTTTTTTTSSPVETTTTTTTAPTTTTPTTTETTTAPSAITVSELSSASGEVHIKAVWLKLYYSKPNYLMEVGDDTGTVNLTIERSLIPDPSKAGTGSLLDLTVDAGTLEVLEVSIVEAKPSPLLYTSEVTFDRMGTTAVVEGNITDFQTIGSNLKFVLADSKGTVTIFIPGSVVHDLPQDVKDGLKNGAAVRISGYITEYRGTIEIIPYRPEGVELLS